MSEPFVFNLDIPDHSNELSEAEFYIDKLKTKLKKICDNRQLNDETHEKLFEETIRALLFLGKLSQEIFNYDDEIEEKYFLAYKHAPALARKLWLEQKDTLHHPYDLLKNRCYKILEVLDKEYHKKFKKHPPNWNL